MLFTTIAKLTISRQRRTHHRRLGRGQRRPSLLDPSRRLPTQATLGHRRFWVDIHLRSVQKALEGEHGGGRRRRLRKDVSRRGHQMGRQLRRCYPHGCIDQEGRKQTSVLARQRLQGQRQRSDECSAISNDTFGMNESLWCTREHFGRYRSLAGSPSSSFAFILGSGCSSVLRASSK